MEMVMEVELVVKEDGVEMEGMVVRVVDRD